MSKTTPEGKLNIVSASGAPISYAQGLRESLNKVAEKQVKVDHSKIEFEERHGFKPPRPVGPNVLLEIYKHDLSETIAMTQQAKDRSKWESIVGRVCKTGGACYKGDRFKDWPLDELPKIGDWVTFKVNSGTIFKYGPPGKGVDVVTIYDDCILNVIEDPSYVIRN